jgi:hypothetical protein
METTAYKTGRLGLSTPEIEAEMEEIRQSVIKRDPEATRHGLAYFYLHTPQEIHRTSVLNAMRMATSCLVYQDKAGWTASRLRFSRPYASPVRFTEPKYEGTAEQRAANTLSDAELDAIYEAQSERLKQATVIYNVVSPEEDGGPVHGVRW